MKNFADGINPNLAMDPSDRRHLKVLREAIRELSLQLAKTTTPGNEPTVKVNRSTPVAVKDQNMTIGDEFDPSRRAQLNSSLVPSDVNPTIYYFPSIGGVLAITGYSYVTSVANDYTATETDEVILVDASSTTRTVTLPTAVGIDGRVYTVKKTDSSTNSVVVDGDGSETIDGQANQTFDVQHVSISVVSDGSNWRII